MKKIFYLKIFTLIVFLFFNAIVSYAADKGMNTLSRIIIEPSSQKEITLNMLFNEEYKGNAFIQKITDGSYYVFLPETILPKSGTKIHYSSGFDRKKIKLTVNQNEAIKDNTNTNYIRISVDMLDDYSINLISGLNSDYNGFLMQLKSINLVSVFAFLALAAIIYMLWYLLRKSKEYTNIDSYTSVPNSLLKSIQGSKNSEAQLKSGSDNSFECFDIPVKQNKNNSSYELKSTLNQTSKLLNKNKGTVRLKHTNPILKSTDKKPNGLLLPAVDENEIKKENIISKLNISADKGFYITSDNGVVKLFGFVSDKTFLIQEFNNINQINLQARYYDKKGNKETYVVRLDNYKALIEVSKFDMRELAKI